MRRSLQAFLAVAAFATVPGIRAERTGAIRATWSTAHFDLTIDLAKQKELPVLGSLLEACFLRQTRYFGYEPDKRIHAIFLDEDDIANGSAYAANGWMVIYLHGKDLPLRGRTRWLPNVVAHELGHIITLGKMGAVSRFLGWRLYHRWNGASPTAFEEEFLHRNDEVPPWLAEGLAQHAAYICGYDAPDNIRRMILGSALRSGNLLALPEMEGFAGDARDNEFVYAQGFFLVQYLYREKGAEAMHRFLAQCGGKGYRRAFKEELGMTPAEAYAAWRSDLARELGIQTPGIRKKVTYRVDSRRRDTRGIYSSLFLSSEPNDFGVTHLYGSKGRSARKIHEHVSDFELDATGNLALFTALDYHAGQGRMSSDLHLLDLRTGKSRRLIRGCHILAAAFSRGGDIYAVEEVGGKTALLRWRDGSLFRVFRPPENLEIRELDAGPDSASLTLSMTGGLGGDLYSLALDSMGLSPLQASAADERDPSWKGDTLLFSSDARGRHEIYAQHGDSLWRLPGLPDVEGHFEPQANAGGLQATVYGREGFSVRKLPWTPSPVADSTPPDTANLWPKPQSAAIAKSYADKTRLSLAGVFLDLGWERGPGFSDTLREDDGTVHPLSHEASQEAATGLGFLWLNPSGKSEMAGEIRAALQAAGEQPSLRIQSAGLAYQTRFWTPTWFTGLSYTSRDFPGLTIDNDALESRVHLIHWFGGMGIQWSRYWSTVTQADLVVFIRTFSERFLKATGSGAQLGQHIFYSRLDPGVTMPNGGTQFRAGATAIPLPGGSGILVGSGDLEKFWNWDRRAYFAARGSGAQSAGDTVFSTAWAELAAHVRMRIGAKLGSTGGRGLFFDEACFGVVGNGFWASDVKAWDDFEFSPVALRPGISSFSGAPAFAPFPAGLANGRERYFIGPSILVKSLGFFPRPELWQFSLRYSLRNFGRDPIIQFRLSM